jgi:hypothetical protein
VPALALWLVLAGQEPTASAVAPVPALERVVVIGASLSAGFGTAHTFAQVFGASLRARREAPFDLGDALLFSSPLAIGKRQVQAALDEDPTLLVAIDFLFWFGYGALDAEGGALDSEDERLGLLERGLALLAEFECPLVLGDFPDMSAAVGGMIAPSQMPAKATLPRLSARVREWAKARGRALVVPLSELVGELGREREVRIGRHLFPPDARLLQRDQLHPTRRGLVAVAQLLASELVRLDWAREEEFVFDLEGVERRLGALGAAK